MALSRSPSSSPVMSDDDASSATSGLYLTGKKMAGNKKEKDEMYCYCRKAYDRYMIGCDGCAEWYHGDCVQITRTIAKTIDKYYCPSCTSANPEKETIYFPGKEPKTVTARAPPPIPQRCNDCINCLVKPDCGVCTRCKAKNGRCVEIKCLTHPIGKELEAKNPTDGRMSAGGGCVRPSRLAPTQPKDPEFDQYVENGQKENAEPQMKECLGPYCCKSACSTSKYCSDACGMELARTRLAAYLPQTAKKLWTPKLQAVLQEEQDIRKKDETVAKLRAEKADLDKWHTLMCDFIRGCKGLLPIKRKVKKKEEDGEKKKDGEEVNSESDDGIEVLKGGRDEKRDEDGLRDEEFLSPCVVCTLCGYDYGSDVIVHHTKNCNEKQEKQLAFGARKQLNYPNNILCEHYNASDKTYCKRLRITCRDHYKEGELEEGLRVCGWPNVWSNEEHGGRSMGDMFTDIEELIEHSVCCEERAACERHAGWINTILGHIDARRFTCTRRVKWLEKNFAARPRPGDALLMMSNHVEYHRPPAEIIARYKEDEANWLAREKKKWADAKAMNTVVKKEGDRGHHALGDH